jgi:hypothetical protein
MKRIGDIVDAMNVALERTELSDFYERRAKLKGKGYRWSGGLFLIVGGDDGDFSGYAFHKGGRRELQFNLGLEGDGYFRYGVAFSLEPARILPDPVTVLRPKIERFNAAIKIFPAARDSTMWRDHDGQRFHKTPVGPILPNEIVPDSFIFLGHIVDANATGVTQEMIERAADALASLLPLYEYVEGDSEVPIHHKVARLCWNTDFWQRPTGKEGKSTNTDAFEAQYGYGHEEWLFDRSTVRKGWKYGFIQALNKSRNHAGETLDLLLYAIEDKSRSRYWVASLRSVHVLTADEAGVAVRLLESTGVLKSMRQQVRDIGLEISQLASTDPIEIVNLRYRPEDLTQFERPVQFPVGQLRADYYGILQDVPEGQRDVVRGHQSAEGLRERNINALSAKRRAYVADADVTLEHKRWQKVLRATLSDELPGAQTAVEVDVQGHSIDVYVKLAGKLFFIELKTHSVVRHAIRQALAQLMEYSLWPPSGPRADYLIVVAPGDPEEGEAYLSLLRQQFRIPVYYLQFRDDRIDGLRDLVSRLTGGQ